MPTISAKVIADSRSLDGVRLTSLQLHYHRYVHSELMTHRAFSRNASSSRAIPIEKMIEQAATDPALPFKWQLNQKGMQGGDVMSDFGIRKAKSIWLDARDEAVKRAREMVALKETPHKQIVNRILEPYLFITVIVTATEFANWQSLRLSPEAQPEIEELARCVKEALDASTPAQILPGGHHLPYIDDNTVAEVARHVLSLFPNGGLTTQLAEDWVTDLCYKISVARCARVSYLNHDKSRPDIVADMNLAERLQTSKHMSPFEHQAIPDRLVWEMSNGNHAWENPQYHGNFVGWQQYRKFFVGENVATNARIFSKRADNPDQPSLFS
jgi:hypothetical protein